MFEYQFHVEIVNLSVFPFRLLEVLNGHLAADRYSAACIAAHAAIDMRMAALREYYGLTARQVGISEFTVERVQLPARAGGGVIMIDIDALLTFLARVVAQYEQSAPTVSKWADDLYMRLSDDMYSVRLIEVVTAQRLLEDDQWEHPNYAANRLYHLMEEVGQITTGHAGY